MAAWARAVSPSDPGALMRRLAWDGWDEQEARAALAAGAPPTLPADWLPAWISWLSSFAAELPGCRSALGTERWQRERDAVTSSSVPFGDAWMPLLRAARGALASKAPELTATMAPPALQGLERHLVRRCAAIAGMALHEEYQANRHPATPSTPGRHDRYMAWLLDGGWCDIFTSYPVLARHLALAAASWADYAAELADRLARDRPLLEQAFGRSANRVVELDAGLSDPHAGGRTVARLRFESGLEVAYKPRDLRLEVAFHGLLAWLRDAGLDAIPRPLRVLDRGTHGFVEWVAQGAFASRQEVADYYVRAGGLACLAHVLGGSDLHGENLVAAVEGPSLIDVEMLLQPTHGARAHETADAHADPSRHLPDSCLAPGLVSLVQIDAEGRACEVGGLQQASARTSSVARREWREVGRDTIAVVLDRTIEPSLANDVRLHGRVQSPGAFAGEICHGFERTSRFLSQRRGRLLTSTAVAALRGCQVRVLFRPSDQYGALQYILCAPRYQRRGLDRSFAVETLLRVFAADTTLPRLWPLVADERDALERLDIPRFSIAATATSLVSSSGAAVDAAYGRSGYDAFLERLDRMDDAGLHVHLDELREALRPRVVLQPAAAAAFNSTDDGRLLRAAEAMGAVIVERAERSDSGLRWTSCRGEADLYTGAAGISLFLAALGVASGKLAWRERARAAIPPRSAADGMIRAGAAAPLGACSGLGSIAYALVTLGALQGDDDVIAMAVESALATPAAAIDADLVLDVEGGAAGLLMALLAVHAQRPHPRLLELAERCVDRLLATQHDAGTTRGGWPAGGDRRPRAGFAHGAAGIACALERWLAHDPRPAVLDSVRAAWAFERGLFAGSGGAWPTTRSDGSTVVMAAWCHGAPGIALARATGGGRAADAATAREIDDGLRLTAAAPRARHDHLCCGNMGRAEVLLSVGMRTGRPEAAAAGCRAAARVAAQVIDEGRLGMRGSGFDRGASAVGFFQGLAGIGYALARAAVPARLPCVLAFEAPGAGRVGNTGLREGTGGV